MIKKIIKVNALPKGTNAVNGLGETLPEKETMIINIANIESMTPPATTIDPGAFAMRYAGETIYVSNECFQDLMQCWVDANRIIEFTKLKSEGIHKVLDATKNTPGKRAHDPRPVTERIRTMTDVLEELGPDHPLVTQYRHMLETTNPEQRDDYTATFLQLRMVCEALNEGWHATCTPGECRYWPWFCIYKDMEEAKKYKWSEEEIIEIPEAVRCVLFGGSADNGAFAGFAYASSDYAPSDAVADVGSRLCFKSRDLALHAARHFHDLWLKFYCM